MERPRNSSDDDRLKKLGDKPLFWFLRTAETDNIQKGQERNRFHSGIYFAETLAAKPEQLNEDSLMILPMGEGRTLFAVLDGASCQKDIAGLTPDKISGAFYLSHIVSLGFKSAQVYKDMCDKENVSAKDVMINVNSWIQGEMKKVQGVDYNDVLTVPGMAAVFLVIDSRQKKASLAQAADSSAAKYESDGTVSILTPNLNEKFDRETFEYAKSLAKEGGISLRQVRTDENVWSKVKLQLQDSFRRKINSKGGCGILNGMPELIENHLIYSDEFEISDKLSSIYLYSDGALLPYREKGSSMEWSVGEFINMFGKNSFGSVLEQGAEKLDEDPEFDKIPRLKPRDDASVIEIRLD